MAGREDKPMRNRGSGRWFGPVFLVALGLLAQALTGRGSAEKHKASPEQDKKKEKRFGPSGWLFAGVGASLIALAAVGIVLYAYSVGNWSVAAAGLLVAAGAFAAGGFLGFL